MWPLFVLCYSPLARAHSVHARTGKRRSEDVGWGSGFRERSRPAEAGDRLQRDLCDGAANDQTHLLAGGDVRHDTPEPPGPAEPADTGTAGMAAGLRQPQQQRLIADPPPFELPRALQRRSPSGYAWQVELAVGTPLVMVASKLMCKELGAGARCRLRKAAANQITALRYTSEPVGVKSFEGATAELRADLGKPALAEALKTTERKVQIAGQRVATLEASLTRQKVIDIPAGGAAANHSNKKVFMQYCGAERKATLREPYLFSNYQVQNLRQFVCELEQHSQVRKRCIVTL